MGESMETTRFRVGKMDCTAEEQLVRMRLDAVEGVRRVDVDLDHRTVVVEHDIDVAELTAALASLNLDSTELDELDESAPVSEVDPRRERRALLIALGINAALFVTEFTGGVLVRSLSLIADSLDMAADASVYALSLVAVGGSVSRKRRLAAASGYLQLGLAVVGLVAVVRRFLVDVAPPDVTTMIVMSSIALAGNVIVIVVLRRVRSGDAHLEASWIFTANDIKVNLLVIVAALAVAAADSAIPDMVAGAIIFLVVANGARRILAISRP